MSSPSITGGLSSAHVKGFDISDFSAIRHEQIWIRSDCGWFISSCGNVAMIPEGVLNFICASKLSGFAS